jgi:hydrogenase maturation protease
MAKSSTASPAIEFAADLWRGNGYEAAPMSVRKRHEAKGHEFTRAETEQKPRASAPAQTGIELSSKTSPAKETTTRCLVLACGNTLRSDDGVGPTLARWAEERFRNEPAVRVLARQQWTPDLAEDIAASNSVLFVDASVKSRPGHVSLTAVVSNRGNGDTASHLPGTHHMEAHELLGLTRSLYGSMSDHAMLLTVGAASTELGESFSGPVEAALPRARGILEKAVLRFLQN